MQSDLEACLDTLAASDACEAVLDELAEGFDPGPFLELIHFTLSVGYEPDAPR